MSDEPRGPLRPSGPPLGGDHEITHERRSWAQKHRPQLVAGLIVVLVVLGIGGAVLATQSIGDVSTGDPIAAVSSSAPASSTAPSPVATATGPTKIKTTGTVNEVTAPGTWIMTVEGLKITVKTTSATKIARKRTVDEIRKGVTVTVTGTFENGVITAATVTIEKKKAT